MPLPQQVIEQLGREPTATPGWSSGLILFSVAIFVLIIGLYLGLSFGYEPYLKSQITAAENQSGQVGKSISSADQAALISYYSEVANLHTLIASHVLFSQFLSWLDSNTEANVTYTNMSFASRNEVSLAGQALNQADINQQLEIFESSPKVAAMAVGTVAFSPSAGAWTFNVTLTMNPSVFAWQAGDTGAASGAAQPIQNSTATTTP